MSPEPIETSPHEADPEIETPNAPRWSAETASQLLSYHNTRAEQQRRLTALLGTEEAFLGLPAQIRSVYEDNMYGAFLYAVKMEWPPVQIFECVALADRCAKRVLLEGIGKEEGYRRFAEEVEDLALKGVFSVRMVKGLTRFMCATLFKYYNGYRQLAASSAAAAPAIEIEACAIRKTIQQPVLAALDLNEAEFCDCTDEETALIQEARASLKLGGTPDPPDPLDDRLASALRQSLEKSTSVEEG